MKKENTSQSPRKNRFAALFSSLIRKDWFQTIFSSLVCIAGGLLVGFIALLIIEPSGAVEAILAIIRCFFKFGNTGMILKYFGQTLVRSVPLLMCALSVLFAYKAGMFNIGVAGQYTAGACIALYAAIAWHLPWYLCLLLAILVGAALGALAGLLKTAFNVNVVISGIMLNWIALYLTNQILGTVKTVTNDTPELSGTYQSALLPKLGLDQLFNGEKSVTIAIPLAILIAIAVWVVLYKTKFGYELKATGHNPHAAQYAGMKSNLNIVLTMAISGGIAALGAGLLFLTGITKWDTGISSLPAEGFNGIAVAFLGGLSPLGSLLSSFFIQYITFGGTFVSTDFYSPHISSLISSLIIYLCAFSAFIKYIIGVCLRKHDEKIAAQAAQKHEEGGSEE